MRCKQCYVIVKFIHRILLGLFNYYLFVICCFFFFLSLFHLFLAATSSRWTKIVTLHTLPNLRCLVCRQTERACITTL